MPGLLYLLIVLLRSSPVITILHCWPAAAGACQSALHLTLPCPASRRLDMDLISKAALSTLSKAAPTLVQESIMLRGTLLLDTWEFWSKVQEMGGYEEVGAWALLAASSPLHLMHAPDACT
jgi:hypothetical protein